MTDNRTYREPSAKTVGACCVCVLLLILVAGLWPFRVPKNDVDWLNAEDGLRFGRHGSIVSLGAFDPHSSDEDGATLEVWLEPNSTKGKTTILAFDGAAHPGEPFTLYQNGHSLGIRRHNVDLHGTVRTALLEVANLFQDKKRVFVTVVLENHVTTIYANGVLAVSEPMGDSRNNLSGRMVVGNSPSSDDSWSGKILGFGMYRGPLAPDQVKRQYQNWIIGQPSVDEGAGLVALYRFDERGGGVAHNEVNVATNLTIPSRYFVLHLPLLKWEWRRQSYGWSYWQDVAINVVGFMPVGFLFLAYCSAVRLIKRPTLAVLCFGFLLSLTIEALQRFLPTRDSDMTDVVANTFGTLVGEVLYRCPWIQRIWQRVAASMFGLDGARENQTAIDLRPISSHSEVGQE